MNTGQANGLIPFHGAKNPGHCYIKKQHPDAKTLSYYAYDGQKLEHLLYNPKMIRTPIVRNGRQATVGYCPDVWKDWE